MMRTFHYREAYEKLLTPEIVSCLTQIHELKGQQSFFVASRPDALRELPEIAGLQSVAASCRMAGITIPDERLKKLVKSKAAPQTRQERDAAGYRDALAAIRENYAYIPIRPGSILALHRDLYKYVGPSAGGSFKTTDSLIAENQPCGDQALWYAAVPARETAQTMENLCAAFHEALVQPEADPLLLMPMFILDFLCIHPFTDGNGRMSRLLTLLLLCRSGCFVGQYVSLEKLMEDARESFFQALRDSAADWNNGKNDYLPFARYMLGLVAAAFRDFSAQTETLMVKGLSKPGRVREVLRRTAGRITKAQLMAQCPDVSQKTVERALHEMLDRGEIIKISGGRYTSYTWNWEENDA